MQLHILENNDLEKAKEIWKILEGKVDNLRLTSRWEWIETWISVYGELIPYRLVYGEKNGMPCGIVLITQETGRPFPLPVKAFYIGTAGEPYKDWIHMVNNSILVTPECKRDFFSSLLKLFPLFRPEEVVLELFDPEEAGLFTALLEQQDISFSLQKEQCLAVDLTQAHNTDIFSVFGHTTRRKIRRCIKAFGSDVTLEWAETVEQAENIFDELIDLHQKLWESRGKRGMFASEYFTKFHREIIKKLLPTGAAALVRVKSKRYGTIGCLQLFIDNGVAYAYQSGVNEFESVVFEDTNNNRIKPGMVTHALCMQECLNRGLKEYNFATGIYRYKQEFANTEREMVTVRIRHRVKPYIRDVLLQGYEKVESNRSMQMFVRPLYAIYKNLS